MKIKCEYCGSFIDDTDEKCEFCGAVNSHLVRAATGIPHTVEELIAFAKQHNLPLKQMHYYLGENYTGPKAIGIYKNEETGNFIVYKNKSDGTRAVRYEGKDESYAVNEIYQKMKSDLNNQQRGPKKPPQNNNPKKKDGGLVKGIYWTLLVLIVLFVLFGGRACNAIMPSSGTSSPSGSGYYQDYGSSGYNYDDDNDSSWWSDNNNDDSWSSYDSWNDDNWNSSDWNWNSSDSWNSGSDWNSNW